MVKVGDIVNTKEKGGKNILPAVVTKVNTYQRYSYSEVELTSIEVLFADGTYGHRSEKNFTRTGRHINIQSVLDSIKSNKR